MFVQVTAKNVGGVFYETQCRVIAISCGFMVSKYLQCIVWFCHKARVPQTDGQTDGQSYDSQDRASIAASRGKKSMPSVSLYVWVCIHITQLSELCKHLRINTTLSEAGVVNITVYCHLYISGFAQERKVSLYLQTTQWWTVDSRSWRKLFVNV